MKSFTPQPDCEYRVIDCEYFPTIDTIYLHFAEQTPEGKVNRVYHSIEAPTYDFYISPSYDRVFYQKEEEMEKITDVRYLFRYSKAAKLIGANLENLKNPNWELKREARNELMASGRLFDADADITYVYIQKAIKYFESLNCYSSKIRAKSLYADIETAFDFDELHKLKFLIESNFPEEYASKAESNTNAQWALNNIAGYREEVHTLYGLNEMTRNNRAHILAFEYARTCTQQEYDFLKKYMMLIEYNYQLYSEVDQKAAKSRIETIS